MSADRKRRSQERIARAEERKARRDRQKAEEAVRRRTERIASFAFSQKLDRAGKHIEDLGQVTEAWLGTDAYRFVAETDPKTDRTIIRANITEPPRPTVSILMGDAVHNLRSALDHLVWELAVRHHRPAPVPPTVERGSEFPIFPDKIGADTGSALFHRVKKNTGEPVPGSGLHKLRGVHPDAVKAIELVQPYHRGSAYANDPLWVIHELDRIDKHRRLNLTAYTLGSVGLNPAPGGGYIEHLHIEQMGHNGPVEHGDIVAAFTARNASFQLNFARQITIAEATLPKGEPVAEGLTGLRDYVRDKVVALFMNYLLSRS